MDFTGGVVLFVDTIPLDFKINVVLFLYGTWPLDKLTMDFMFHLVLLWTSNPWISLVPWSSLVDKARLDFKASVVLDILHVDFKTIMVLFVDRTSLDFISLMVLFPLTSSYLVSAPSVLQGSKHP